MYRILLLILHLKLAAIAAGLVISPACAVSSLAEDQLPKGAKLRLTAKSLPSIRGLVYSPDGKLLATRGEPGDPSKPREAGLYDAKTGKLVRNIVAHEAPLTSLAFSPDSRFLATGQPDHGTGTQIWHVGTGRLVSRMEGGRGRVNFVGNSNQVAIVAPFGRQDIVRFHNINTGRETRRVLIDRNYRFALSPFGNRILSLRSEGRTDLMLSAIPHEKEFKDRTLFTGSHSSPAVFGFAANGRTVAAASSKRVDRNKREHHVLVWEVATGRVVHDWKLHAGRVLATAFSSDGRFVATAGFDKTVKVWELATGKLVHSFVGHTAPVAALAFSPDGNEIASGGFDRSVLIWNFAAKRKSFLPTEALNVATLRTLWSDLTSPTPEKAYRAIGRLTASRTASIPFLKAQLVSILLPAQNKRIQQLIAELDDDDSIVRNRAMRELIKLRKIAMPLLLRTLKNTPSSEVRFRVRRILADSKNTARFNKADEWRMLRVIHAVESSPGKDAEAILELIQKEFPRPDIQKEAKQALQRLRARS